MKSAPATTAGGSPAGSGSVRTSAVSHGALAAALMLLAGPLQAQDAAGETAPAGQPAPGDPATPSLPIPAPPEDAALPEVETVISREELDAAVPELPPLGIDPLDGPLESIAEFERRIAAEQAAANPQEGNAPPLNDPALADGDAVEEIGDAPIRDAELLAPLPPLGEFQVEPVEFAEGEADEETVELAYTVRIDGLEAVDAIAATDLRDQFNDLSALDDDDEVGNAVQLAARLAEDSVLLQRILAAEGWFGAQVTTRIDRADDPAAPAVAVLEVVPGPRYTLAEIVVDAPPTVPANLIRDTLALEVGEPIVAARVQGAEAQVAVTLSERGYPFVEVGARDVLLDPDTGGGVYTLPVTTGPRAVFNGIRTTGNLAFDAEHIRTLARFKPGELYDSRLVDDLRQALVATGLFSTVTVRPEATGEPAPGEDAEYAAIVVEQNAGPPRTIAASAGYGTGQGFRVQGSWQHRNLFPPEGALIASAVLGTQEQGASVTFRRANAGRRDRTFQAQAEVLHQDYEAYEAYTGRLSALWSYDSTPIWQKPLTYAYGGQLIATNEQDYDFTTDRLVRRTFFIGGLTGQVGFDRTDDLLDATRGFRLTALLQPEGSLEGGFSPYLRAQIDGSAYFSPTDNLVLAGRVRLGTIQGVERFDIAPSRRMYAGGGGSVRGYGFQQLGPRVLVPNPSFDPQDEEEEDDPFIFRPVGGRSVNEAAVEVRYRFGAFGAVAFVDAGQAYEQDVPRFNDLQFGAGIGARYYTNFGPLRIDLATPLNRRPGDPRFTVYVSIGQAF